MTSPLHQAIANRAALEEEVVAAVEAHNTNGKTTVLRNPHRYRMHQKNPDVPSQLAFVQRRMAANCTYMGWLMEHKVIDPEDGDACLCYKCRPRNL